MKALILLGKAQESLIKKIISSSHDKCVVFSVYDTDIKGAIFIGGWAWLYNYIEISRALRECYKSQYLELYTPHFVNFVANILLLKCKNIRAFFLYDGILNFRKVGWASRSLRKTILLNRIKSLFYLSVFRSVGKKINDESAQCVWGAVFPESLSDHDFDFSKKIFFIDDGSNADIDLDLEVVMVLEPVLYSKPELIFLAEYIKKFCIGRSIRKIVLKTHPRCNKSLLLDFFSDSFDVISLVGDVESAEKLFFKYKPGYVLGDYSSALLNIKSVNSAVNAYSYGPLLRDVSPDLESVVGVMKGQGVFFFERT